MLYSHERCRRKDEIDGSDVQSSVLIAIQILNYDCARDEESLGESVAFRN